MSHRFLLALAGTLVFAVLLSSVGFAGNNAGGRAFLSWDRAGTDTVLTEIPAAPSPLFLHLRDAPDVHALAARIRWTTNTEDAPPCYFLASSPGPDSSTPQGGLFGWAVNAPPGRDFEGDSTYTWTVHFPDGSTSRDCVQYLVAASDCGTPAFAMFEAVGVVVLDESGIADTLSVGAGARISPLPTTSVSVGAVTPTGLRSGELADLEVSGRGFGPGTRVYLRRDGQRTQASSVAVEDSTALRAQLIPTFGAGETLDLVVTRPLGGESALGNAVTEIASTTTGTQSWAQIRPTTQDHPFTQIDVKAPTTYTHPPYGPDLVFHVHHGYPATLDSLELRVTRLTGDTVAVIYSQPTEGIGFDGYGYYPAGATFTLPNAVFATSLGTLVVGGDLFDGAPPNDDLGRSLLRCSVEYGPDTSYYASESFAYLVGTHVRNWTSGTLHCGEDSSTAVPLYEALPTDSLVVALETGSPGLHYDFQERRLSGRQRPHPVFRITFASYDNFPATCVNRAKRTSSLFGATLWSQFQITSPWTGDTLHTQLQTDTTWSTRPYGGRYWRGDLIGTDATIDSLGCALTCLSAVHTYFGLPCTPDTLRDYLQRTSSGFLAFQAIRVDSATGAAVGDTLHFRWARNGVWPSGTTLVVIQPDTIPLALVRTTSCLASGGKAVVTRVYGSPTAQDFINRYGVTFSNINIDIASRGFSTGRWHADSAHYGQVSADTIEAALRDSLPVLLFKSWPNGATHWVVGKGMEPVWPHVGGPKGTYGIMDPLDSSTTLYGTYGNFCYAGVRCMPDSQPLGNGPHYRALSAAGGTGVRGLAITVASDASVTLLDPSNRRLTYNASEEGCSSGIPGQSSSEDCLGGGGTIPPTSQLPLISSCFRMRRLVSTRCGLLAGLQETPAWRPRSTTPMATRAWPLRPRPSIRRRCPSSRSSITQRDL